MSDDNWRNLAEKATNEQDKKLMALVAELNGVLSQREAAQQHRNSKA